MKKIPIERVRRIAQELSKQALSEYSLPDGIKNNLHLTTGFEDDCHVFHLYVPEEKPEDGIIATIRVHAVTGDSAIEVFLPRIGEEKGVDKAKKLSTVRLEGIARTFAREVLRRYIIPETVKEKVVSRASYQDNFYVIEDYVPGEQAEDDKTIAIIRVNIDTTEVEMEVFLEEAP
ncbi:MAG: hypothetical protein KME12_13440 [Trichocoleus desertorum ATA4-8-CV12]|nr:hypothetical protein [Trichocoleus desertorum ATA4-8-CV12]